jgi:hypothetical protein
MKKLFIVIGIILSIGVFAQKPKEIDFKIADTIEIPSNVTAVSIVVPIEYIKEEDITRVKIKQIEFPTKNNTFTKNGKTYFIVPKGELEKELKNIKIK